jgi:hypothetical protein
MNVNEITQRVAVLEEQVLSLQAKIAEATKPRDRGPASERPMNEIDAWRVKFGDMKDTKHKVAATSLGISYGQVYSARGGYTFKQVKADWLDNPKNKAALEAAIAVTTTAPAEEAQQ